ncbi:aminotransferase class V-fold PLP-dependent enzyme [Rheinheimera texasensis]|uniref:aminotransferase class V-fold PLP-dependent enzyme n=1 Tax=Rheinheimera texasensis TaxID=306205 RepID=UPI0004E131EF|nr:cysteine desulfurase [Rheinheimera texasensis]
MLTAADFRAHFPFFAAHPDWVYLDNAATTHKPKAVIARELAFYQQENSNVHRAAHGLAQQATSAFEQARTTVHQFLRPAANSQLIWTSGTTAGLNQLAFGLMGTVLQPGDRILLSALEHHANIVPWQFHCERFGVFIDVVPLDSEHRLDLVTFHQLLEKKPKVVSLSHVSNGLGHIQPVEVMVAAAKAIGALTVVDGAQGVSMGPVNLAQIDCDFYLFSGHKLYGPTGIGALYGKTAALELLRPLLYGGEMIKKVSFTGTELNDLPYRLEAGTPNIAGALGLAAAVEFLQRFDLVTLQQYKQHLLKRLYLGCQQIPGLQLLSGLEDNAGIVSLVLPGEHPADLATLLDQQKIAVRAGSHCAMPLFAALQQSGAVRLSLAAYNTEDEVDLALAALTQAVELF